MSKVLPISSCVRCPYFSANTVLQCDLFKLPITDLSFSNELDQFRISNVCKLPFHIHPNDLERKEIYTIDSVLKHITFDQPIRKKTLVIDYDGDLMDMASLRYLTFKLKGLKCVKCGIEGRYFAKEFSKPQHKKNIQNKENGELIPLKYHFNLYAINDIGEEVLMTKDHIHPVSKGGRDFIDNFQTMCFPCNDEKGAKCE